MTKHKTIAEIAVEVLNEDGIATSIGWGDAEFLHEIADRATHTNLNASRHPLLLWARVLNALEKRPDLFTKGYIRCSNGRAEVLMRRFWLKGKEPAKL